MSHPCLYVYEHVYCTYFRAAQNEYYIYICVIVYTREYVYLLWLRLHSLHTKVYQRATLIYHAIHVNVCMKTVLEASNTIKGTPNISFFHVNVLMVSAPYDDDQLYKAVVVFYLFIYYFDNVCTILCALKKTLRYKQEYNNVSR